MATPRPDGKWQRLKKSRRAAVYRAIGRAARDARESGDREIAADVRIAIDVLRARARKAPVRKGTGASRSRR
jgi:hypothetical protein